MELAAGPTMRRPEPEPVVSAAGLEAAGRAAALGDRAAFGELHRLTVARVHTLARRLLGRARADEATQEVYLRAWRGLPGWRGEASVATWLHSLARNTLINLAARAELRTEEAPSELEAPLARPGLRLELEEAIAALPDGARAIFVLHDVEGLAHAEIAAHLGLSVGTSKSQLHRARLLLRAALREGRSA